MALIARIHRATCIHGFELSPGELSLAMSLVGLDIVARLAPHAPNVTPIAASAVFAGMVLRSRALALAVPISALLLSDLVAGSYDWRIMGVVYAALALPALLASWARARPVVMLAPLVLSSSLLFFATTNFAVWAFSGMYAHDLHGLVQTEMAGVRLEPQRIEHEHAQPLQERPAVPRDLVDVGAVGDVVDAETEHVELGMDERRGRDALTEHRKRLIVDAMKRELGDKAGLGEVGSALEGIGKSLTNLSFDLLGAVERHRPAQ